MTTSNLLSSPMTFDSLLTTFGTRIPHVGYQPGGISKIPNRTLHALLYLCRPSTFAVTQIPQLIDLQSSFAAWVAIAIQALFCVAITVVKICLCVPIPAIWDGLAAYPDAKCINRQASFIADTAFAAVADLIIFVPPLILTWSLSFSCEWLLSG